MDLLGTRNLVLGTFMKICRENTDLVKTGQKVSGTLHVDLTTWYCCRRH
jgi:hypothetical protein